MKKSSINRMQMLAGLITESQYKEKEKLEEISLSGTLGKIKDKISSLALDKFIDKVISGMSEKDKKEFLSKVNTLNEAKDTPSVEDILSKVHNANPDKDATDVEDLKEIKKLDEDTIAFKIAKLVRNLTGLNLLALGGAPLGVLLGPLLTGNADGSAVFGALISVVATLIIHRIASKLEGRSEDDSLVRDD